MASEAQSGAREDVIIIDDVKGSLSLELMPVREQLARAVLRFSPRGLKLTEQASRRLSDELSGRPYSMILVQDNKRKLLRKALGRTRWGIAPSIAPRKKGKWFAVATYDVPLDEGLLDHEGMKPDLSSSSYMSGLRVELEGRKAWVFYTDAGDTARLISEKERKLGMIVAKSTDDMFEAADALVSYLAASGKSWAVFSTDLGRFIRRYNPISMYRMVLDRPRAFEHGAVPVSSNNKSEAVRLFSEYYDESTLESMLRLRKYRFDPNYSTYLVDGGFVITRLDGDTALVFDIYVSPSMQGRGKGEELIRCALTDLAGKVSSCYLHTSYPRAKRLYEKFGFRAAYSQLGIRLDEIALTPPRSR